jgi:hypothetical protein
MNIANGRWIFVSTGDVSRIVTFFRGVREQGCETSGVIYAPKESRKAIAQAGLDWPKGWSVYTDGDLYGYDQDWIGLLWEDQCPEHPKWDVNLVIHALPWRVVTSGNAIQGDWRQGAIVWGPECLKAGLGVDFRDDLDAQLIKWSRAAMKSQCWFVERGVNLPRHVGPKEREFTETDDTAMVAALSATMAKHGVRVANPDWTGVSLMIATPSMASRPEALYTISLFSCMRELDGRKVSYNWSLERYNADIGLARSHIFSEFVRSKHTHLLMIDDDMTFEMTALHRLIYANKPLVAIAGPKKRYPLVFAASHVGADGKPLPLIMEDGTGCAEVSSVGGAFMMIRRDCAEQMVKAYPELEYLAGDGKVSWGMFVQAVRDRNYLAEDFSFCQRWRDTGGKVYICPDVPLGHIGAHEFKGDLLSNSLKNA